MNGYEERILAAARTLAERLDGRDQGSITPRLYWLRADAETHSMLLTLCCLCGAERIHEQLETACDEKFDETLADHRRHEARDLAEAAA